MKALCKPLRCLSFLGGRKPPDQYSAAEGQHLSKAADDDEDEDDFFGDSWGEGGASGSSASQTKEAEAQRSGVERNPTRETTTKRPAPGVASQAPKLAAKKQEADFFNELGMEPEYRAPRVLEKEHPKGSSVSSLLDEPAEVSSAAWGDDLDLPLR
ncbi:unnamed protein product [Symbiodinium pilosum]|uniref:Uncharacterized protein n=1 Tax=Symbiodinium pilosum TaxID=2952 RepID=A0A812MKK0_SYMPI|nr:unnamed protein product [Symbiodinium pilosum]